MITPDPEPLSLPPIDDETAARIESEILRRMAAGEMPHASRLRDDGPDPLGIDFAWARPEDQPTTTAAATERPLEQTDREDPRTFRFRWSLTNTVGLVTAACLLIGIGIGVGAFVFQKKVRQRDIVQAEVNTSFETPRGPNTVSFKADVQSKDAGFVTVILFRDGKRPIVYPDYGEAEIRIAASQPATIGALEGSPGGFVLVVITETPATESIRRILAALPPNVEPDTVQEKIPDSLFNTGFRWVSIGRARVPGSQ